MRAAPRKSFAVWRVVVGFTVLASACSSAGADKAAERAAAAAAARASIEEVVPVTASVPPSTEATTTTEAPTTTTSTTEPEGAAAARAQATGEVRALQERLAELGYDIGPIDGGYGGRTAYTVMAFQKVEGLRRTGEDSPALREALAAASRPGPMAGGPATRIEIDLNRQVLFHWKGGELARILPVSSGNGERFCVDGACDFATTPPGSFRIGRKAAGLEVAPLGELWWPMYFNGGIAIHGSPSVPAYPASHGCIRIPMYAAPSFYDQVAGGTPVIVVGRGPGPVDETPPPEPPPNPVQAPVPVDTVPETTTTTVPETTTTAVDPATTSTTSTTVAVPPVT